MARWRKCLAILMGIFISGFVVLYGKLHLTVEKRDHRISWNSHPHDFIQSNSRSKLAFRPTLIPPVKDKPLTSPSPDSWMEENEYVHPTDVIGTKSRPNDVTSVMDQTTPTSLDDIRDEHLRRISKLQESCHDSMERHQLNNTHNANLTDFYYSEEYHFAYCKVPKSGSTFWMKMFAVFRKGDNYSQYMTKWSRTQIHDKTRNLVINPARIIRSKTRTVIVSRNPYSRLHSAYIDKVYTPLLWDQIKDADGVKLLKPFHLNFTRDFLKKSKSILSERLNKYRDRLRERGLIETRNISVKVSPICANHVSFEQFLQFVIAQAKAKKFMEPHWAPISGLCHPCQINTYSIIKQETFSRDVEHTLNSFGIDLDKYPSLKSALNDNRAETSVPSIVRVLARKARQKTVNTCISHSEIIARMWKAFQIQGFISDSMDLPDQLARQQVFDDAEVTSFALSAISQKPLTSLQRHRQRHAYLVKAYKGVSAQTIKDIQDIYGMDFLLFDYDLLPPT